MRRLSAKIMIMRQWAGAEGLDEGQRWTVERVHEIHITGGSESLQDTCTIVLAKEMKWRGYERIPIRRGDEVSVWMGYDGALTLRFVGYVKEVSARTPTTLTCEDTMFVLQQKAAKQASYGDATLKEILTDQLPAGISWESSGEVRIGAYRVTATTVAGVLEDLKENYGVTSCFVLRGDAPVLLSYTVYGGLRRLAGRYAEGRNVISDSLTYRRREDMQIKIHGVSILADNSRISYEEGEGELRTVTRYGLTLAQLTAAVKDELERLKWEGLSGSFETFGVPEVQKCDVVELDAASVAKGRYMVDGVDVLFGNGGYRQRVELGRMITEDERDKKTNK